MKETSINLVVSKLEELIEKKKGKINPYEAALATGYSLDEINSGFSRLLELFESKVSMDPTNGAIVFDFAYPLRDRGKKSFKEIMTVVAEKAYKIFKKVYKVSIGVILIVYTVLFALIMIGIMIASSNRDSDSKGFSFDFIGSIFLGIIRGMQMAAITSSMVDYQTDSSGMRYRHVKSDSPAGKKFIPSVYDFVFGPERVPSDPLSDAREVLAYLKKISNGKLTAGSILLLAGGDYDKAESKLAEYSGRFQGDLSIANDGTLTAEFNNLQQVEKSWLEGKIVYYFDETDEPYIMNGNSGGKNFAIIAMNLFNFIASIVLMGAFIDSAALAILLGIIPFIFSLLFFLIPLIRIPYNAVKNKERSRNILRKKLFRGIIKNLHKSSTSEELYADAGFTAEDIEKGADALSELVIDLRGDISISEQGKPLYSFTRLSKELKIS